MGKVSAVLVHDVIGTIQSLVAFQMTGWTNDSAIIGSDSGPLVILEYDCKPLKLHQETFRKSCSRGIVPGQYLAVDPEGMIRNDICINSGKIPVHP